MRLVPQSVITPIIDVPNFNGIITFLNKNYPNTFDQFISARPSTTSTGLVRNEAEALINRTEDPRYAHDWCSADLNNSYFIISFPLFNIRINFKMTILENSRSKIYQ